MTHLTRTQAVQLLSAHAPFASFLKDFKAAQGYTPEQVLFLDDHKKGYTNVRQESACRDFIAVLRIKKDGTLIEENRRPAAWIFPGFSDRDWRETRTQNPLYVGEDGSIHLSTGARGSTLYAGDNFRRITLTEQRVHFTNMAVYDGEEDYEAHIHLTLAQLNEL